MPEAGIWGLAASPDECEVFGEITAADARSVGIDVLFAPVLDVRSEPLNPIVGNRSFGWDAGRVATLGAAFARGAARGGVLTVGKHFPGHGATREDSHDAVPKVVADAAALEARELVPFLDPRVVEACHGIMTAHAAFPALDPSEAVATLSRPIIDRLGPMGARPLVFTDGMMMDGVLGDCGPVEASRRALIAGCDVILYPENPEHVAERLLDEPSDELDHARMRAAVRVSNFTGRAAQTGQGALTADADEVVLRVSRRALQLSGGDRIRPETRGLWVLDDDDFEERGRVLIDGARAKGVPTADVHHLARDVIPGTCVVISTVRAWKGAAGISDELRKRTERIRAEAPQCQWIWITPLPGPWGVHVPGAGPQVERALCERLFP